uniref:Sulfatase domain-containing protein n=1 Tax=Caenorhabditis tropicalis TaxID=1561998 RepID=A0A1I7TND2_9PELO
MQSTQITSTMAIVPSEVVLPIQPPNINSEFKNTLSSRINLFDGFDQSFSELSNPYQPVLPLMQRDSISSANSYYNNPTQNSRSYDHTHNSNNETIHLRSQQQKENQEFFSLKTRTMHNVPWAALIVSGCMIVYVVFLGIASYSPSFVPEKSYGIYHAIIGNMPEKYQKMVSNTSNDPWEHCELPKYDVWDEQIIPYVNPDRNPLKDCDRTFKPLTELKNSSWSIVSNNKNLECRARCHWRKTDRSNKIGDWIRTPGPIDCEFVEAACSENKQDVYGYLHSQVIPKPAIKKPTIETSGLMQFDVFVILLDSLSYSQGKRSLPRTLSYFTNHMDGVIFPYVNKIGENSRPNGVPIWFGKSLEKVDKSLFGEKVVPPDWSYKYFCKTFKDNETSLFSEFHDYGYRTLLAEDWAEGTMNWPNCVGFDKPPIDHFMRPFQNAYERRNHGTALTQKHLKGGHLCRQTHNTLLDYMGQFTEAYPDQKKFGWLWAIDLGHNSENGFHHADKDFHNYLIKYRKQLENSFVFILGDHGLRFGGIRDTFIGALDVNNPFTALSIPRVLRKTTNILEYLTENAKHIQSHYDTRATILDIMKTLSLLMYDHKFEGATLYTVTAEMKEPSRAQFKGNVKVVGDEITVLGMVERSNKYGKTAECVRSEYHRPYCYCRDQQIGS